MKSFLLYNRTIHLLGKLFIVVCLCFPLKLSAEVKWERLNDDLEIAKMDIWTQSVISPELFLVKTSLKKHRLGVIRAADFGLRNDNVKDLSIKAKSILAINANFFDENGKALGLVISRGIKHQNIHYGGGTLTGIFQVDQKGVSIINRSDFQASLVTEAVQSGPRLIIQGKAVKSIKNPDSVSKRAGICINKKHEIIIFISSGLMGISMRQVQQILESDGINCFDALNLDGGGSAQLYLQGGLHEKHQSEVFISGRDNIPVAIGLFVKE